MDWLSVAFILDWIGCWYAVIFKEIWITILDWIDVVGQTFVLVVCSPLQGDLDNDFVLDRRSGADVYSVT